MTTVLSLPLFLPTLRTPPLYLLSLLATTPVPHIIASLPIFINPQPMFLVLDILAVVDIPLGFPFQPEPVFAPLVQVLILPASQIPPAVIVPNQASISSDGHDTIGIFFDD